MLEEEETSRGKCRETTVICSQSQKTPAAVCEAPSFLIKRLTLIFTIQLLNRAHHLSNAEQIKQQEINAQLLLLPFS